MDPFAGALQVPASLERDGTRTATGLAGEVMTLISPDFDIIMMHPVLSSMWGRPMSSFLGKKCYREFEKRDATCPHCPGLQVLASGAPKVGEVEAILEDGTRVPLLVRAYPVQGPHGKPLGFIEVHENIALRRWGEQQARFEIDLMKALLETSNASRVMRLGLEAALTFDGVASGCAFLADPNTTWELVAQDGLSQNEVGALWPKEVGSAMTGTLEGSLTLMRIPIVSSGELSALLMVRLGDNALAQTNSVVRLEALAAMLTSALARIRAERLRGDAVANAETFMAALPVAAFCLDGRGWVTAWNQAAKQLFAWRDSEAHGSGTPCLPSGLIEQFTRQKCRPESQERPWEFPGDFVRTDGSTAHLRLTAVPVHDVIGDGTSVLCIAQDAGDRDLSAAKHSTTPEQETASGVDRVLPGARILAIQGSKGAGVQLKRILEESGNSVLICTSALEAAEQVRQAQGAGAPFALAIVDVLMPHGLGGLEAAGLLRTIDPTMKIVLSSDSNVVGDVAHGFVASLHRPYEREAMAEFMAGLSEQTERLVPLAE